MFAKAMSFAGRKVAEPVDTKMDTGSSKGGDPAAKRRQFGRDITNSTIDVPVADKNVFKPSFPPAPAAATTARVDDIMLDGLNSSNEDRTYMDRPSDDIDARDVDNPLLCTDYVNQMYDNFAVMEKEYALAPEYMSKQSFINEKMRAILCDWLVSDFCLVVWYFVVLLWSFLVLGAGHFVVTCRNQCHRTSAAIALLCSASDLT